MTIQVSENQWLDPHFPSAIVAKINGQILVFGSAYQWYLYHKSRDKNFRKQVLTTINTHDLNQVDLGHRKYVPGWRRHRLKLMLRANLMKFKQNPALRRLLIDTELDAFEADLRFGWGCDDLYWCRNFNGQNLRGKNKLADVLARVRSRFKHWQTLDKRTQEEEE